MHSQYYQLTSERTHLKLDKTAYVKNKTVHYQFKAIALL